MNYEEHYKADVLRFVSEAEAKEWLAKNPPPNDWTEGPWAWAFLEMPARGPIARFLRRLFA